MTVLDQRGQNTKLDREECVSMDRILPCCWHGLCKLRKNDVEL